MSGHPQRFFLGLLGVAVAILVGAIAVALRQAPPVIDPDEPDRVAEGRQLYDRHCASCHGAKLEGQPNWREALPGGRMPAPPHDASGHTWHHPDEVLFGIVKEGLVSGKFAPPGYRSDMPAFAGVLSDEEIAAVLSYIMSTWPEQQRRWQRDVDRRSRDRL